MLSKKTYRKVVNNLDHYRKQHEQDRKERPNLSPIDWGGGACLRDMIEHTVRDSHEQYEKGQAEETLKYLAKQGLLVDYAGGYTFPSNERLPTREEIIKNALKFVEQLEGK